MQLNNFENRLTTHLKDHELPVELQKIYEVLSCSRRDHPNTDNWEVRLEALRQLCEIARSDISTHHAFLSLMSMYVKVPLQRHIEEVRTVLSTEACAVVTAFANHSSNRSLWRVASEWFIPSLLQLSMRSKRISLQNAIETLETLARKNSFGPGAFTELLRGCTARHAAMRRNALTALRVVIEQGQNDDREVQVSNSIDDICRVLRACLSDADAETRRCARLCFWTFNAVEPEAAEELYKGLEISVKRALDRKVSPSASRRKNDTATATQAILMPANNNNNNKNKNNKRKSTSVMIVPKETEEEMPLLLDTSRPLSVRKIPENQSTPAKKSDEIIKDRVEDPAETWTSVQECLQSTSWSERLSGLRRLAEGFPHFQQPAECFKLLIPRLNDPNPRVAQVAMEVLRVVVQFSPVVLKGNLLTELLAALLVNMSRNKEELSRASREHLATIIEVNSVDDLAHAIYRILGDVAAPKVKQHALEYAQHLYEQNATHFEQISPMNLAMTQLLQCLRSEKKDSSDVYKAALSALTTLYVLAQSNFLRSLLQFPQGEREALITALETAIPHLAQEYRRCSRGERMLQHAPVSHAPSPFSVKLKSCRSVSPKSGRGLAKQKRVQSQGQMLSSSSGLLKKRIDQNKIHKVPEKGNVLVSSGLSPVVSRRSLCAEHRPVRSPKTVHQDSMTLGNVPLAYEATHSKYEDASDLLNRLDEVDGVVNRSSVLDKIQHLMDIHPKLWMDTFGRLLMQLERLIPQSSEPSYTVRRRGLLILQTAVRQQVLYRPIIRQLKRIFLITRAGIDDVFPEVNMEGTSLLHMILSNTLYPIDHTLNAIAMSLENWLCDSNNNNDGYSSRGWLMLLESVEHIFSQYGGGGGRVLFVNDYSEECMTPLNDSSDTLSEPVLRRVCGVIVRAIQHTVSEVRLTSVLVCVSMWRALDVVVMPYLVQLTASQRKLVSLYFNKNTSEHMTGLNGRVQQRDLSREMRAMGLPEAACL